MNITELFSGQNFQLILPLLIFFSRIVDVSLGTLRIIFVNKGMRYLAPIVGFFEILIWLIVISQIISNLSSPLNYLAYAAGFAVGNFVGIYLENKLALGITLFRIITRKKANELITKYRSLGYSVTNVPAKANSGDVEIIFLPIRRKDINSVIKEVKKHNPNALYTIEDVRVVSKGAIPYSMFENKNRSLFWHRLFRYRRKGK
ncbi:MAG: DUF2179 domain-containing protein [Candidatus Cloacimonetes bacterium]|nr:DUF2179 domain-containing protein [Candidatus Cloacimonadota bacterium]MBL7149477.1 DUF2179 domain-containing protein [Candidatus Cloacimonadota bacterium]